MRFALTRRHEITVGARHRERLPHDQLDVRLRHVERHDAGAAFHDQIDGGFDRRHPLGARDLVERFSFERNVRLITRDDERLGAAAPLEVGGHLPREP